MSSMTNIDPLVKVMSGLNDVFSKVDIVPLTFNGITDSSGSFTQSFLVPIRLNSSVTHKVYMQSFSGWQNIPNIFLNKNDNFTYVNSGNVTKSISLPVGAYQILDLNDYIQQQITING